MEPNKSGKTRMGRHSRKLNDFCTARMIATIHNGTGEVSVKYISSHTNHELGVSEYRNLPLPPSVKENIREQFAAGITIERIMDSEYSLQIHIMCIMYCAYFFRH